MRPATRRGRRCARARRRVLRNASRRRRAIAHRGRRSVRVSRQPLAPPERRFVRRSGRRRLHSRYTKCRVSRLSTCTPGTPNVSESVRLRGGLHSWDADLSEPAGDGHLHRGTPNCASRATVPCTPGRRLVRASRRGLHPGTPSAPAWRRSHVVPGRQIVRVSRLTLAHRGRRSAERSILYAGDAKVSQQSGRRRLHSRERRIVRVSRLTLAPRGRQVPESRPHVRRELLIARVMRQGIARPGTPQCGTGSAPCTPGTPQCS